MELSADSVRAEAERLGFARVGFAAAGPLEPEGDQLRQFVAEGKHGQMGWLADTVEVRADPRHEGMLPGARSVVVLVAPYARAAGGASGPPPGKVARYARGRDYHNVLKKPLRKLEAWMRAQGVEARYSVDSRPVFERAWAERAGVGFIGKNCCLIVPGLGSHVFLACIVTTAKLTPDEPMKRRCGSCSLCLDLCPTKAFEGPRQLDARACISYLTIEHRGEIPAPRRAQMGSWMFGCDVCQDVCPYNATSPVPASETAAYAPDARLDVPASALLSMDESAFSEWATGSPMKRTGRARMARNAAIVLGNEGSAVHLPVLQRATRHDDPTTAEAAVWALGRVGELRADGLRFSGDSTVLRWTSDKGALHVAWLADDVVLFVEEGVLSNAFTAQVVAALESRDAPLTVFVDAFRLQAYEPEFRRTLTDWIKHNPGRIVTQHMLVHDALPRMGLHAAVQDLGDAGPLVLRHDDRARFEAAIQTRLGGDV